MSETRTSRLERHGSHRAVASTPMLPHLQELEAWRGLAAFAVLLTHAGFLSGATSRDLLPGFLSRMDLGVTVFFVLSGFLLYRPHANAIVTDGPAPATRRFAIRRVARIVPAWLAVLVGALVLVPATRTAGAEAWVANLLQIQALRFEWDLPGLTQLWSLSTEIAFYLCLPLIALGIRRTLGDRGPAAHLLAIGGLMLAAWSFRLAGYLGLLPAGYTWLRTFPAMLDWFALGMLLAVLMANQHRWPVVIETIRHSGNALLVLAAAIFWVLTTSIAGPYDLRPATSWQMTVRHLGAATVAALLIYPSAVGARTVLTAPLRSRPLGYLGKISYGFFLWHMPVMFWVRATLGYELFDGHFWVTVVATTLITTVIAAASWHVIERPILNAARRRT